MLYCPLLVQRSLASVLSAEWSVKLQSLLETHAPIPKLQPLSGPIKPSDNDPTNFGMINAPVSVNCCAVIMTAFDLMKVNPQTFVTIPSCLSHKHFLIYIIFYLVI